MGRRWRGAQGWRREVGGRVGGGRLLARINKCLVASIYHRITYDNLHTYIADYSVTALQMIAKLSLGKIPVETI